MRTGAPAVRSGTAGSRAGRRTAGRVVYIAGAPLGATELRSIRPDGTGMRRLTSNYPDGVEPAAPAWLRGRITPAPSPDRLFVTRGRDGAALRMPFPVAVLAASGS